MKTNADILKDRSREYDRTPGPRHGDFLKLSNGEYTRFTYTRKEHDDIQTGTIGCGSFYLGGSSITYSGTLNSAVKKAAILPTPERKLGEVWFFDQGEVGPDRAIYLEMEFRVFELRPGVYYEKWIHTKN